MSNKPTALDEAEEKILTYVPSDEVLEAAVGPTAKKGDIFSFSFCTSPYVCPWSTPADA